MKIVYVAGPYTAQSAWEVEKNVRRAEEAGLEVARLGAMPLVPHANCRFYHGVHGVPDSFWYRGTLELLLRSDAMVVVGDWESSRGSKLELEACDKHDIPFFWSLEDLRVWLEGTPRIAPARPSRPFRRRQPTASYASVSKAACLFAADAAGNREPAITPASGTPARMAAELAELAELDAAHEASLEAEAAADAALKRAEEGIKTCVRTHGRPAAADEDS